MAAISVNIVFSVSVRLREESSFGHGISHTPKSDGFIDGNVEVLCSANCCIFSMKALSVFAAAMALIYTASSNAYVLTEKFVTEHYGVYEAILGKTEIYNDNLEQIMIKDMTARKKFQTTTIVFNYSSKGLSSTIKEPAVSVITTEQYNNTIPATVNINCLLK